MNASADREPSGATDPPPDIRMRRPTEADYRGIAVVVDDWWDGNGIQGLLPRLWFRHFAGTSWIAEIADPRHQDGAPRVAGFLIGYLSPADPAIGVIQAVGVHPRWRRIGVGKALVEAFAADASTAGATVLETLIWPGNRRSLPFLAALGFGPDPDPDARPIYGIPAIAGYDFGTEDRARFTRALKGSLKAG